MPPLPATYVRLVCAFQVVFCSREAASAAGAGSIDDPPEQKFSTVVMTREDLEIAAPWVSALSPPGTDMASSTGVDTNVEPTKSLQNGFFFITDGVGANSLAHLPWCYARPFPTTLCKDEDGWSTPRR
jgi:hypothetical protein